MTPAASASRLAPVDVCVTGGTGFVGREVVSQLLASGYRVRLLVRPGPGSPNRPSAAAHPAVQRFPVDLARPEAIARASEGAAAAIHLVGIISESGDQTFERVHTGITRAVVAGIQAAGVRRLIHMSALGTRPGARSRYHRTKWEAEEAVRASALDWTILRPSLIYGADDAFTNLFARMSSWSPLLPVIGGGRNRMQPVAVTEVAKAFARALEAPESVGLTLDLCGPERLPFIDILRAILAATGRRRWLLPIPWPVAIVQARLLEVVFAGLLHRPPPLNRDQLLMLQEDNVGDGTTADRLFGLHHEPLEAALRRQFRAA